MSTNATTRLRKRRTQCSRTTAVIMSSRMPRWGFGHQYIQICFIVEEDESENFSSKVMGLNTIELACALSSQDRNSASVNKNKIRPSRTVDSLNSNASDQSLHPLSSADRKRSSNSTALKASSLTQRRLYQLPRWPQWSFLGHSAS